MGIKTLYEYFYKLAYGDKGTDKATLVNDCLDVADAAIKANLDGLTTKQPLDTGLTSIAALTTAANKMIYTTALDTYAVTSLTAFARTILDDADEATFKATVNLEIGTDIQAFDNALTSISGLTYVSGSFIALTANDTYTVRTYAQTRSDISAAILGANADITSLTGLTTPLGAAYGGTGVANNALNTITFTGNFTLGLTLTANTSVTLPTSGTLLTKVGTPINNQIGVWTGDGTIEGDANLTYDGTTLVLGTGQINFPASQNASADANTLDDYEEGSWTPALKFGGNSVDMTYSVQAGEYTKIGRQITITCYILLTAKGTSTGIATINGLPFTCKNANGAYSPSHLYLNNVTFANVIQSLVQKNTTSVFIEEITEGGTITSLTEANFANNSVVMVNSTYFTD